MDKTDSKRDERIRRLLEARARIEGARGEMRNARDALRAAVREASAAGIRKAEIARLLGLSRQRIQEFFE